MIFEFATKTAIISGAAHGIGRAVALALVERGADVWAIDINQARFRPSKDWRGKVTSRVIDVTDREAIEVVVAEAERRSGRVDILVNCAGGVLDQTGQAAEEVTSADWSTIIAANLTGAFYLSQCVATGMKAKRGGRIINISGCDGLRAVPDGIQAYSAAKAGLIGLTRQLAQELGPFGITVNSVAPGFIRSNPSAERRWDTLGPEGQRALLERVMLKRLGSVEDVVSAVMFFASEFAGWITAQTLAVDGGG